MHARSLLARGWLAGLLALAPGLVLAAWPDCVDDSEIPGSWNAGWEASVYNACTVGHPASSYEAEKACGIAATVGGSTFASTQSEYCLSYSGDECIEYYYRYRRADGIWPQFRIYRTAATPAVCPEECEAFAAGAQHLATASGKPDSYVPPDTICASNCELIRIPNKYHRLGVPGDRELLVTYQATGLTCELDTGEAVSVANTETCVGPWCRSVETGENCGYVNDAYTCLDRVSPDRCVRHTDGSMICAEGAPMPPKPDNGTAGTPATPTETIEACSGENACQQINYYNPTAVSGSSRPVPEGTGPSGSGAIDGQGPVTEGEEGQGSASGGLSCDAAPACDGDPIACAILAQQWRTRCVESPSDSALEGELGPIEGEDGQLFGSATFEADSSFDAAGWMGAGACLDDYTVNLGTLLGTVEIPFSEWCWLLEVIGTFVMIAAYVSAARIVIQGI